MQADGAKWPRPLRVLHKRAQARPSRGPILSFATEPDSGLPPHVHGPSHLLLLEGTKEWALWPPAVGLQEAARRRLPPPLGRSNASEVFELLRAMADDEPSRPLFCTQLPGDVAIVPGGVYHATRNVGSSANQHASAAGQHGQQTIGVGGQAAWSAEARLSLADALLEASGGAAIAAHVVAGLALTPTPKQISRGERSLSNTQYSIVLHFVAVHL